VPQGPGKAGQPPPRRGAEQGGDPQQLHLGGRSPRGRARQNPPGVATTPPSQPRPAGGACFRPRADSGLAISFHDPALDGRGRPTLALGRHDFRRRILRPGYTGGLQKTDLHDQLLLITTNLGVDRRGGGAKIGAGWAPKDGGSIQGGPPKKNRFWSSAGHPASPTAKGKLARGTVPGLQKPPTATARYATRASEPLKTGPQARPPKIGVAPFTKEPPLFQMAKKEA